MPGIPRALEGLAHVVDERGARELLEGEVHAARRDGEPGVAPFRELAARALDHPAADRHEQPALLGDVEEMVRREEATSRVLPADERLHPGAGEPLGVEEGLVDEAQLVAFERAPEFLLHRVLRALAEIGRASCRERV